MSTTTSVNKPTNTRTKDADISRKLQLYGIISAFRAGKVPTNDQIDVALNSFLATNPISSPSENLSHEGQVLVCDFAEVVKQAKNLILSKNEGNLLQDFIWETQQFDSKSVSGPNAPVDKETSREHSQDALQGLKTLGTLLITNGQFRKLLKDATVLLRDMAGDAATKFATRVKPSDEELSEMDRTAESNKWHDVPDFSKENWREKMQTVYNGNPKEDLDEVRQTGQNAASAQDNSQAGKDAATSAARKKFSDNIPAETKEKAHARSAEYRARTREYMNQKMPEQRRDQVIFRLKKMVMECQSHPDYHQAIETLLRLAEQYGSHSFTMAKGASDMAKQTRTHLETAEADLKTLIERFANGTSMDPLLEAIRQIYKDSESDPELKDWFRSVDKYIRNCLQEDGYIMADISSKDGRRLYDHGHYLLRQKYRLHVNRIVDEAKFLGDQFEQDSMNKEFGLAVQKLFKDLGQDESGKPTFKPQILKDVSDIIIPSVLENVMYIPIPRIEYSDPQFDAVIENLVLESDNFAPNAFEIDSQNSFRWGRKQAKDLNRTHNTVEVSVKGIQMDLKDVSYHIKRKQGFPSITDTGVADILLPGNGLSLKMRMSSADRADRQHFFKVENVNVDFKNLKIKVKKSNHKLLFKIAQPLMLKAFRPAIRKAIEKAIKDEFNRMDTYLYNVKQEAEKSTDMENGSPNEKKSSNYSIYINILKKMLEDKRNAEQKMNENKRSKMAFTKEDSIFPDIHLPGGVSSKATEYKELARKGDKWESPVFSIGQAAKSMNIPAAPVIKRKEAPKTDSSLPNHQQQQTTQPGFSDSSQVNGNNNFTSAQ